VLTCAGRSYAGRFAMSQLHGIGVPELITADLASYEELALALAQDPQRLRQLRATIEGNRKTWPLFDTQRLCRELESAYETMVEIWRRGENPRNFSVSLTPESCSRAGRCDAAESYRTERLKP
jgi:protein O-GlcNAc transferase